MTETSLAAQAADTLRKILPRRFRSDLPVVPVVRLSGVIGFSTPLRPGLTLSSSAADNQAIGTIPWNSRGPCLSVNRLIS